MITELYNKLISRIKTVESGCWEWQGAISNGYGNCWWIDRAVNTNRLMYLAVHETLPNDKFICHTCDNKLCINPDHLFEATPKENMDDMTSKGRRSCGPKHSEAIRNGWTVEKRAKRADQTRSRMRQIHELLAEQAGVSPDWKHCPDCKTWYPRSLFNKNRARYDGIASICKKCKTKQTNKRRKIKRLLVSS